MELVESAEDVAAVTREPMVRWAAQALEDGYPHGRGAAWRLDGAVVVHAPLLNRHHRLVFSGPTDAVAEVLGRLPDPAPELKLRALGTSESSRAVAATGVTREVGTFGWMDLAGAPVRGHRAEWIPDSDLDQVASLLGLANPSAYVVPGDPGARRWAGIRDASGRWVSVAADAWSATTVGFVAGVATRPEYRGRGLSREVCGWLTELLHDAHGAVALMVDRDNPPARAVYEQLGFTYRSVTASAVATHDRRA